MIWDEHFANEWCELVGDGKTCVVVSLRNLGDARIIERRDAEREEPPPAGAPCCVHEAALAIGKERERTSASGRRAVAYVLVLHESGKPLVELRRKRVRTQRGDLVPRNRARVKIHTQHWQQVVQRAVEQPPMLRVRRGTIRARQEQREL